MLPVKLLLLIRSQSHSYRSTLSLYPIHVSYWSGYCRKKNVYWITFTCPLLSVIPPPSSFHVFLFIILPSPPMLFAAAYLGRFWISAAVNAWLGFALAAYHAVFASPSQDKLSGIWGGCNFTFHTFHLRDSKCLRVFLASLILRKLGFHMKPLQPLATNLYILFSNSSSLWIRCALLAPA